MKKGHLGTISRRVLKRVVGVLPPSFPTKIYRFASSFPLLKKVTNLIIRSFIPPSIVLDEGVLLLNQSDVTVCGALALGAFEKNELDLFRRVLRPGMTVVDIGANIGLYTTIASHRVGTKGKVFAYEPEPENFSFLQENIAQSNLGNCIAFSLALADKLEERVLYLAEDNKGHHSFSKDHSADKKLIVKTDTLDHSLELQGRPRVDVIKIDIEGAEPLVFRGLKQTIEQNPSVVVFTEIFPNAIRRLGEDPLAYLEDINACGLSIWVIDEDKKEPSRLKQEEFVSYIKNFPKGESFQNLFASRNSPPVKSN